MPKRDPGSPSFWAAPHVVNMGVECGDPDMLRLDAPERIAAMEAAQSLGMSLMVHIGDPDTWFATKYADSSMYGTKLEQYEPLRTLMDQFKGPWIAAHMGGWPEDLEFLGTMLSSHDNLYLDCSATKWMVRELSCHSREHLESFLRKFQGRVLFGSDIVTMDEHLKSQEGDHPYAAKAGDPRSAFDLYASRYWALRTLFESDYCDESPICDPGPEHDRQGHLR